MMFIIPSLSFPPEVMIFTIPLPPLLVILDSIPREHYASAFSVGYSKIPVSPGSYDVHHTITFIHLRCYVHTSSVSCSKIPISLGCYDVHHTITFISPGGYFRLLSPIPFPRGGWGILSVFIPSLWNVRVFPMPLPS
jgi:hypothetical protein